MKNCNHNPRPQQPKLSDADLARLGPAGLAKALDLAVKVQNRWRRQLKTKWQPVSEFIESIPPRYCNRYLALGLPLPEGLSPIGHADAKAGMATYFFPDFLANVKCELRIQDGPEEIRLRPSRNENPQFTTVEPKVRTFAQLLADYFKPTCPGCGVATGEFHKSGCRMELCSYCGGLANECTCPRRETLGVLPADDRRRFDGFPLTTLEAIDFGWFHYLGPQQWIACGPDDHLAAVPDVQRVLLEASWDLTLKRYVLPAKEKRSGTLSLSEVSMYESHEPTNVAGNNGFGITFPDTEDQSMNEKHEDYREVILEDRRRDHEECHGYPLNREELRVLARHWAKDREDNALSCYFQQCVDSSDFRRSVFAGDRLALMDEILGKEVVDAVFAEVKAEQHNRDGWEYWDAARRHDEDYRTELDREEVSARAYLQEKEKDTEKVQQVFEYLSKNPFGFRLDESGDMWTFVRSEDGKRLVLNLRMINGSGRSFSEYSIASPARWTPRFGISNHYPRIC